MALLSHFQLLPRLLPRGPFIENTSQNDRGHSHLNGRSTDSRTLILVSLLFLGTLFGLVPHIAHAFGFQLDFFGIGRATEAATPSGVPSFSTPALAPVRNVNPGGRGGGDITVVLGSGGAALESESGPLGTSADVTESRPESDQISIYVVREGDTLSQIAKMFNVSTNTVVWANDLGPRNIIHPGDTLVILPVTGVEYTVKKGDTLASIVKKYKGDIDEVRSFNSITTDSDIAIGDTIVIPGGVEPQVVSSGSTTSIVRGGGGPVIAGYYLRPLVGGVRSQGLHGYNGVDLASSCGAPILASAAGEVIIARASGWNGGYGGYVVVKHPNGTQTLYAHLSSVITSFGQSVVQGQVIGYMGRTGRATGCHVHFEIRGAANPF